MTLKFWNSVWGGKYHRQKSNTLKIKLTVWVEERHNSINVGCNDFLQINEQKVTILVEKNSKTYLEGRYINIQ